MSRVDSVHLVNEGCAGIAKSWEMKRILLWWKDPVKPEAVFEVILGCSSLCLLGPLPLLFCGSRTEAGSSRPSGDMSLTPHYFWQPILQVGGPGSGKGEVYSGAELSADCWFCASAHQCSCLLLPVLTCQMESWSFLQEERGFPFGCCSNGSDMLLPYLLLMLRMSQLGPCVSKTRLNSKRRLRPPW